VQSLALPVRGNYSLDPPSSLLLKVLIIASSTLISLSFFAISSCFSRFLLLFLPP
jgi:hypothetical protein